MALTTVIHRAVNAVRAYFQRERTEQIMNFNEITPAAVPIMSAVYKLLCVVFISLAVVSYATGFTMFLRIDQRSSLKIAMAFYGFWLALLWTRSLAFFNSCSDALFTMWIVEYCLVSIVSYYSPSIPFEVYADYVSFVMYVTTYSEVMALRIAEKGENSIVKHAICFFTDFPYVSYHIARMTLERIKMLYRAPEL